MTQSVFVAAVIIFLLLTGTSLAASTEALKTVESPYFFIYTDLDSESTREAALRMTCMEEVYRRETGNIRPAPLEKLPFYLYRSAADYYTAGAPAGSAGVFMQRDGRNVLMVIAGNDPSLSTWHTVQHEGLHQFVASNLGDNAPVWLNEGLAEYFGEAIFTGDGFTTGLVPPWRLKRLRKELANPARGDLRELMRWTPRQWAARADVADYDLVWSMVQFLKHGDGGKHAADFTRYLRSLAAAMPTDQAWNEALSSRYNIEREWKAYWLSQSENPTSLLYGKTTVSILTSFLARGAQRGQTFASFNAFHEAAATGKLAISDENWLPPSLLVDGLHAAEGGKWRLDTVAGQPLLAVKMSEGVRLAGRFTLRGSRVERVSVEAERD